MQGRIQLQTDNPRQLTKDVKSFLAHTAETECKVSSYVAAADAQQSSSRMLQQQHPQHHQIAKHVVQQ